MFTVPGAGAGGGMKFQGSSTCQFTAKQSKHFMFYIPPGFLVVVGKGCLRTLGQVGSGWQAKAERIRFFGQPGSLSASYIWLWVYWFIVEMYKS